MLLSQAVAIQDDSPIKSATLVHATDFEKGAGEWQFIDKDWKVTERQVPVKKSIDPNSKTKNHVLSQFSKKSNYKPSVRSPLHMALLKDKPVTDFEMDVRVLSTHADYDHRDACLFFGYQSPTEFYYVHLGKRTDPHANQIFIVNNEARTKISLTTTEGTPWDENWHRVRITRNIENGEIKVFYDDMQKPVMTAVDKTFKWGRVGLGSFDDTADWDDFSLKGVKYISEDDQTTADSANTRSK